MTEQTPDGGFKGTERGGDEEETPARPAPDQSHDDDGGELLSPPGAGGQRPEEFNPDDFE
ncbi:hypothetical protein [Actinomadura sp. 3N407]|uniref:hypothetical protein n=1 Tax=Actinomadura sp. 3N407 TaxID=3457423 RepID=UPI003FCC42C5